MAIEQIPQLQAATLRRADAARTRARTALRLLDQQGAPINYVTVAQAGNVSRSLLYRDPELRAEIDRLRSPAPTGMPRQPAAQQMSQASRRELDATLRHEIKELRHENHALRNRLATVLGEIRSQHHQTRPELVNDMSPTP